MQSVWPYARNFKTFQRFVDQLDPNVYQLSHYTADPAYGIYMELRSRVTLERFCFDSRNDTTSWDDIFNWLNEVRDKYTGYDNEEAVLTFLNE